MTYSYKAFLVIFDLFHALIVKPYLTNNRPSDTIDTVLIL